MTATIRTVAGRVMMVGLLDYALRWQVHDPEPSTWCRPETPTICKLCAQQAGDDCPHRASPVG